jgi:hypothetical protein
MCSRGRAWVLAIITVLATSASLGSMAAAPAGPRRDELPVGRDLVTFANVRS